MSCFIRTIFVIKFLNLAQGLYLLYVQGTEENIDVFKKERSLIGHRTEFVGGYLINSMCYTARTTLSVLWE